MRISIQSWCPGHIKTWVDELTKILHSRKVLLPVSKVSALKIVVRELLPNVTGYNGKIRDSLRGPSAETTVHSLNYIQKKLEPLRKIKISFRWRD